MKKNHLIIGVLALVILCLAGAFGLATLSGTLSGGDTEDAPSITGNWTEDSTGVAVAFTDKGVFQIMDGDAATYLEDKKALTLTLTYAEAYGGQVTTMNYQVTETKLTLTNNTTGEVQTYTRVAGAATPTT